MEEHELTVRSSVLWTVGYLGVIVLYTLADVALWKNMAPGMREALNLAAIALCSGAFVARMQRKTGYRVRLLQNMSVKGAAGAVLLAFALCLMLDRGMDLVFARMFPQSEQAYREGISSLMRAPASGIIRVCVIAPAVEEILMRGFVLGGLWRARGAAAALVISSLLFALMHLNIVQSLSAFICGVGLGALYLKTGSVLCCMLAHGVYNLLSCIGLLMAAAGP